MKRKGEEIRFQIWEMRKTIRRSSEKIMGVVILGKNLRKALLIVTLTLGTILNYSSASYSQSELPKYTNYTIPSPAPAAPGESFSPPMQGVAKANTPVSAEWTRTAGRDESMVITGADFTRFSGVDEGKDTRFTVYGSKGFYKDASIQRLDNNKVAITLDENIPSWSMYLIWPGNDAGYGAPIAVNKTDAWWVGPNKATRGSNVSVYGRNLSQYNDSISSNVYIKSASGAGQWATVTKVNPYKVDFVVPSNLANGDYEVWTHNGHGGEYGWSGPLKLTINDGAKWTQTVFDVKSFGAMGNGVTDDTNAILRALAAAKNSFGSTVYFPEGSYMISNMLMPSSNTKWLGAGNSKTFIKCKAGFTSTDAMIYGIVNTFEVSDITFDTNNNYKAVHASPFFFRGSSNLVVKNVVFSFANYDVLQLDNTNNVSISNCKSIGKISFLGTASQLFIDKCDFYQTNDTENSLHSWGGTGISVTNTTCQDYNNSNPEDGSGWGKGRFFVSTGNFGSGGYTYLGNNRTINLTVRESTSVDQNSGEQFLWEGFSAGWSGAVVSSSGATTSLNGYSGNIDKAKIAVITKGRGLGQSRKLIAVNGSTVTLESPWNVQPDQTSIIAVGHFADKIVMYNNFIDGKEYAATSPNPSASAGIEPYGGVLNFIADKNTISDVRAGIANWSTQHSVGIDPNYWSLYTNNKIIGCRWGMQNGLDMYRPTETALLGTMVRRNTINTTLQSGIVNTIMPTATPVMESFVYEHNDFSDVRIAFSTGGDFGLPNGFPSSGDGISTQTFYKNNFSSSANLSGITVTQKIALRNNTFTGFAAPYSGLLSETAVKSPLHVIEVKGIAGSSATAPFTVWNSGISAINWKASSNSAWLKLSDTVGVINDERGSSNITLKADASTLAVGNYSSDIAVTVNGQIKKYTVRFTVEASAAPKVTLTSPIANSKLTVPSVVNIKADASDTDGTITKVEFFSGTTKLGEDLTSPYSFDWNNATAGTYSLTVVATDNVGLTTTSAPVELIIQNPIAPVVALTSPSNNTNFTAPASTSLTATASDEDGTISKVEFFFGTTKLGEDLTSPYSLDWSNIAAGNYTITAKATDNSGLIATSSTININVNAPALPIAPVVALASPTNNTSFIAPASTSITATASDEDGTISKVEFFFGTTKLGEDLTSPYNLDWSNIAAGTYTITAKATDNSGLSTTSSAIQIIVNAPADPIAPVVALTSPSNNSTFTSSASTTITATASDQDGTITKVEFFAGSTKLGEDLTSPYSFSWNNIAAGNYTIIAKATDNSGLSTTSNAIQIVVNAPADPVAPVVVLTSPSTNSTFTSPASTTITATASDQDGTITKVEFFAGATKLGEDLTSPYSFSWNNIAAGNYVITAKATDNSGLSTISNAIQMVVNAPADPVAPVVALTSPSNNSIFTSPASTTITATASDQDGTIAKVEFFAGSTKLGEDLTSPYSLNWNTIATGTYSITAKATDNSGLSTISQVVNITVNAPVVASAPQVSITSPVANSIFTAQASATITANASDQNGSITKVEFFAGATKLGEDLTYPYIFTWNNIATGKYIITAKATNSFGVSSISSEVAITVNNPVIVATNYNLVAYPNPFQQYVNIEFTGIKKEQAYLQIYNLQGILLETLYKGKVEEGINYSFKFDGGKYPSGTYLSRLVCGKSVFTNLLVLSR